MRGRPALGDAFGAAVAAGWEHGGRTGQVFEIVERDDGNVRANDVARYFAPSWGHLDEWMYEHSRGRVLDVGCGAGRSTRVLVDAGLDVVGLDVSAGALEVCRRRGLRSLVQGTVHTADLAGPFDTFVLAGNNVGLLGSPASAGEFLARLAQLSTGTGAQIVGTAVGREPGGTMTNLDRTYEQANLRRGRPRWQVTMRSRFANLCTEWFDYLFITVDELAELIRGTGWRITDTSQDGAKYSVRMTLAEPSSRRAKS